MHRILAQLVIAAITAALVFVLGERTLPYLVIGALLALVVWVGLFAGSYATPAGPRGEVEVLTYAVGAGITVALGYVFYLVGDSPVWWSVGAIFAIAIATSARAFDKPSEDRDG